MKDVNCKYSNGIVPYMYGESATSVATEFETHLLECQACTDEFAALSAARYEVYDWKKLEFDPLASPAIRIPFGEVAEVSWIGKLRAAFSTGWAMPVGALAGLAFLVVVLAVLAVSRQGGEILVQNAGNTPANGQSKGKMPDPAPTAIPTSKEQSVEAGEPGPNAPRPTVVRDITPRRSVRTQQTVGPRATSPRTTTAQTPTPPRLNEFAEEKDDSLRLAQLFEDIDTSE
jgi:hypothetical protein